MMDKSKIPIKYYAHGRHVFVDGEKFQFATIEDAKQAIEIIETVDVCLGGIKHIKVDQSTEK